MFLFAPLAFMTAWFRGDFTPAPLAIAALFGDCASQVGIQPHCSPMQKHLAPMPARIKTWRSRAPPGVVKVGTEFRKMRLIEGDHAIDCKIEGFGPMQIRSEVEGKAS